MERLPVVALTAWKRDLSTAPLLEDRIHTLDQRYTAAVRNAGAIPVLVGPVRPEEAPSVLDRVDGLVVTGGPDLDPDLYGQEVTASVGIDRDNDDRDLALIQEARRRRLPVLAICRGMQAVNVALGGDLHQHCLSDGDPDHPELPEDGAEKASYRHRISMVPGSRLAGIYGTGARPVNSLHHQAVDRLAPGLVAVARTGRGHVEAMESTDGWPMLAVQWHPERMETEEEAPLFRAFVADAADYATARKVR